MRNNYTIILITLYVLLGFTSGILVEKIKENSKHQDGSIPFNGTVGVDSDTESALAPILKKEFSDEYKTIMAAATRNSCYGENLLILFAIRKAENGPPGLEFGVLCQAGTDLDTQAGWAAATIIKNRERWKGEKDFIVFLGSRYCPPSVDPQGHINWIKNVTYWFERFRNEQRTNL